MNFGLNFDENNNNYNFAARRKKIAIWFLKDHTWLKDNNYRLTFQNKCEVSTDKNKLLPLVNFSEVVFKISYYKAEKLKTTITKIIPNLQNDDLDFSTSIIVKHKRKTIFEIHDDRNFKFMGWNCHILSHNKWEFCHDEESKYKFSISNKIYSKTTENILEYIATMENYVEDGEELDKFSYTIISKHCSSNNARNINNSITHFLNDEVTAIIKFTNILPYTTDILPVSDNIKLANKYHPLFHRKTYLKIA